jgi:hypothetical protein
MQHRDAEGIRGHIARTILVLPWRSGGGFASHQCVFVSSERCHPAITLPGRFVVGMRWIVAIEENMPEGQEQSIIAHMMPMRTWQKDATATTSTYGSVPGTVPCMSRLITANV